MKWRYGLLFPVFVLVFVGLLPGLGSHPTAAEEAVVTIDAIRNGFALGVNNDHCPKGHDPSEEVINSAEWFYDEYITISKCGTSKNSHPYDLEIGGAMFKNGPIENSGYGLPDVPAHMWQVYDSAALGIPEGAAVTVELTLELVSVGGTSYTAVLESSPDGEIWTPQATLMQWPQESCGLWKYPLYCGTAVVDYAPFYRLALTSLWSQQLGQKWVIHHLYFSFAADIAEPTPTATVEPTTTPLPTPTETPIPLPSPTAIATAVSPAFTVENVTLVEGNSNTQDAVFVVRLLTALPESVVLDFETVAETAVADDDFMALRGSIIFAPGESSQIVIIPVWGDTEQEADETFCLKVTYDDPAAPLSIMATAYILNDDQSDDPVVETFSIFLPLLTVGD